MKAPLTDRFGRPFHYLRLSVEDACNFGCVYCLPNGWKRRTEEPPLSPAELGRAVRAFAGLGLWKVRLTGGEPTVRADIVELVRAAAEAEGVRRVALSTNGFRLAELAAPLARAGLAAVNVSVDSLDPARFERVTGRDRLAAALAGVERCLELGLETKVNVVLLGGLEPELGRFLDWTRRAPVGVRFIELMPTGGNRAAFEGERPTAEAVLARLRAEGWREEPRREGDGPARRLRKPGHAGSAGVVAPYSKDFCSTCNRLRLTSRGALRLCLFADGDRSLRHLLRCDGQLEELQEEVRALLSGKEETHGLHEGRLGATPDFAVMGG